MSDDARSLEIRNLLRSLPKGKDDLDERVKITARWISPDAALKILGHALPNRAISKQRIRYYAKLMKNGLWCVNGETIIMDTQYRLMNGQHRLWACIEAGVDLQAIVITGLPSDVFATLDGGKNRTAPQVLQMAQFENTSSLATACRCLYKQKAGGFPWASTNDGISTVSSAELLTLAQANPGLIGSNDYAKSLYGKGPIPKPSAGFGAFFHFVISEELNLRTEVEDFMAKLFLGVNVNADCPTYRFREYMSRSAQASQGAGIHGWYQQKAWIVAWELWRAGIKITSPKRFDKEIEKTPKPFIKGLPLSDSAREQALKENTGKICHP
jgi:hypothetical protein